MPQVQEGTLLWTPSEEFKRQSNMAHYMDWLQRERGLRFSDYDELWRWSVTDIEGFWTSIWEYFNVKASKPYTQVLTTHKMPEARWFEGAELNYAEHLCRYRSSDYPALVFQSEIRPLVEVSWDEFYGQAASIAAGLRRLGVKRGDRVVALIPNIPEAIAALIATASLGAIWSSCSPDFGTQSIIDRFRQIEPKVLFATDGYQYGGRAFDKRPVIRELQAAMPTLEQTVLVPYLDPAATLDGTLRWQDLLAERASEIAFEQVPFSHPLWVLYSSGTTGLPKPIVHGHGGVLLESLKGVALHHEQRPGQRIFWYSSTGWMMWNFVVGALSVGSTPLLYDGSPGYPNLDVLWKFAQDSGMTFFGTSAAFVMSCVKAGLEPRQKFDLSRVTGLGSTGSPLPPEGFQWVYEQINPNIWLASLSGGTDVVAGVVGGCPLKPVYAGEIQCRLLGHKVEAFDEQGRSVIDQVGELVITEPAPSMPLFLWNDPDNRRYVASYFDVFPGVWRHGDWIKITPRGSCIIYGRSDSTLNRFGVRLGSSEIYRAVEGLPEVVDSLIVGVERPGGGYYMPLFVVLAEGVALDDALEAKIGQKIREEVGPRFVPDEILAIRTVPRTLNGKKVEVPIKKILMGVPVEKAVSLDALSNPDAINEFTALVGRAASSGG